MSDVRIAIRAIEWPVGSGVNAFPAGARVPLETVQRLKLYNEVYDPYPRLSPSTPVVAETPATQSTSTPPKSTNS